jgi:hypothetical protein
MFHGSDQLPLGPHANRVLVLVHRLVDDLKRHKRRQFEILQGDADLGGTLSDEADVRRGDDDFVDSARALCGTVVVELKRQSGDRRQLISGKLESEEKLALRSRGPRVAHSEVRELRQLAHSTGNRLSWCLWT